MIVNLPIVFPETTLDHALELLQQADRGAVAVSMDGKYRLIEAADIAHAYNAGVETIYGLAWHKAAPTALQPADTRGAPHDMPQRMALGVRINLAHVEVSDDDLVFRIANEVRLFRCTGDRKHRFLPGEVTLGQDCPENDGGVIEA